jgi:hypothetical protein
MFNKHTISDSFPYQTTANTYVISVRQRICGRRDVNRNDYKWRLARREIG